MTLKYRTLVTTITAVALGLALGWGLGTQQIKAQDAKAPAKNWKSTDEYNLYEAFSKAKGKDKIAALDKWKAGFADSDYAFDREEAYLGTYQELGMTRQYFDKAVEILKTHPNHFFSIYAVETALYGLNPAQPAPPGTGPRERLRSRELKKISALASFLSPELRVLRACPSHHPKCRCGLRPCPECSAARWTSARRF